MKTKNLETKLKSYSALAAGVLATSSAVNAQVVYTDVIPDATLSLMGYSLNLNNDAVSDFTLRNSKLQGTTISSGYFSINMARIDALNNNEMLGSNAGSKFYPFALDINALIDNSQQIWESGANRVLNKYDNKSGIVRKGNFQGVTDKYLGLRFQLSGQWHYGWARLDIDSNATVCKLKDYAYEATPNKEILAGQTITAIDEAGSLDNMSVYAQNKNLFLDFNGADFSNCHVTILNTTGQEVKSFDVTDAKMKVNLNDLNAGVYLVGIRNNEKVITKKVYIR